MKTLTVGEFKIGLSPKTQKMFETAETNMVNVQNVVPNIVGQIEVDARVAIRRAIEAAVLREIRVGRGQK